MEHALIADYFMYFFINVRQSVNNNNNVMTQPSLIDSDTKINGSIVLDHFTPLTEIGIHNILKGLKS